MYVNMKMDFIDWLEISVGQIGFPGSQRDIDLLVVQKISHLFLIKGRVL